ELRFRLHPVGPIVLAGWVLYPQERAPEVLRFYRDYIATAPDELTTIVILRRLPQLPSLPPFLRGVPVIGIAVCYAGVIEQGERPAHRLGEGILRRHRALLRRGCLCELPRRGGF